MSKIFDEWWRRKCYNFGACWQSEVAENAWNACKAEALRLLKDNVPKSIPRKPRTFEDVLADL